MLWVDAREPRRARRLPVDKPGNNFRTRLTADVTGHPVT